MFLFVVFAGAEEAADFEFFGAVLVFCAFDFVADFGFCFSFVLAVDVLLVCFVAVDLAVVDFCADFCVDFVSFLSAVFLSVEVFEVLAFDFASFLSVFFGVGVGFLAVDEAAGFLVDFVCAFSLVAPKPNHKNKKAITKTQVFWRKFRFLLNINIFLHS